MGNFGSGLSDILPQLDAPTQHSFLPFLSLYPLSDLPTSLMAFSATSLAIFLMGLFANKSLTHLILLLATYWRSWNNTLRAISICFHLYSSSPYAFIIETSTNVLLPNLALEHFPPSYPAFSSLHAPSSFLSFRTGDTTDFFKSRIAWDTETGQLISFLL